MKARIIATLMMHQQVDVIVSSLVNAGYTVEPGLKSGKSYSTEKGNVCGLMVIIISKDTKILNLCNDVKNCINKVKHYSYTIHNLTDDMVWIYVGNFLFPEEEDRRNREKHADKLL